MIVDIIVDLQYGDCGKGKVTHHLCKQGGYTHVVRYNGGCNAGHTIYHEGTKFVTHHIPAGVFFGIKSVIGPGCVINPEKFFKEIKELEEKGIRPRNLIKIAKNCHVITRKHLSEDADEVEIGTTKSGNGPAYRDKYSREGIRAENVPELRPFLCDFYEEMHQEGVIALFEGAQGFGLDIDWGDYPYVTSSHCTVAGALLNGIPPKAVRNVWGVAKVYETYVGSKKFHGNGEIFDKIRRIGNEFGATTGRPRQCNWLSWQLIEKALNINGVTHLVFNKTDVLREADEWKMYDCNNILQKFVDEDHFKRYIQQKLAKSGMTIYFSGDKATI